MDTIRVGDTKKDFQKSLLLRYWLNDHGDRVYTVKKVDPLGRPTMSAHPPRFSFGSCTSPYPDPQSSHQP